MRPRKRSGFDALVGVPWWVALLFGAIGYLGVRYMLPMILSTNPMLSGVAVGLEPLAIFIFSICAAAALLSAIRSWHISRKFNQQKRIQDLSSLTWEQFEVMLGEAFRRQGYRVIENGGGGPDGGVDLVVLKDGKRHLVQCKQWKSTKVGVKSIRELHGIVAAEGAAGGIFVTVGHFTEEARRFAARCEMKLIDAFSLIDMIGDGRRDTSIEATRPEFSAEPQRDSTVAPSCPKCGLLMIHRTARRGPNAGNRFWGCPGFPACKGTRAIAP